MHNLNGWKNSPLAHQRTDFRANSLPDCREIFAARGSVAIQHPERNLSVKYGLTHTLHRQELRRLAFQFLDAAAARFRNRTEKDHPETRPADSAQRIQKRNHNRRGRRKYRVVQILLQLHFRSRIPDSRFLLTERPTREIDYRRSTGPSSPEIDFRKRRRSCEENQSRVLEAPFFHRLNYGRFATRLGQ